MRHGDVLLYVVRHSHKQQIYPVISIRLISSSQLNVNELSYKFVFLQLYVQGSIAVTWMVVQLFQVGVIRHIQSIESNKLSIFQKMNMGINLVFGMWWGTFKYIYMIHSTQFFSYLDFLWRTFTNDRTAGEGGGYLFNSSLPLPPASQTYISWTITADNSPLHIASSQTWNGNLWFPGASC